MFKKFKEKVMGSKDKPSTDPPIPAADAPIPMFQPRSAQQKFQAAEEPEVQQQQQKQKQQKQQQQQQVQQQQQAQQQVQQQQEQEPYYQEEQEEDPSPVLQVRPRSQNIQQASSQNASQSRAGQQRPGPPAPLTTCTFLPQTLTHMRTASTSLSEQAFPQSSSVLGASRVSQAAVPRMIHPGGSGNREYGRDSAGSVESQQKPGSLAPRGTSNTFVRNSGSIEMSSPRTTSHSLVDADTFFNNSSANNNYSNNEDSSSNSQNTNSYYQDVRTNRKNSGGCSGSLAATAPAPPSPTYASPRPPSAGPTSIGDSSTTGEAAPLKKQSSFKKLSSMFRRPSSALKPASLLTSAPALTPTAFGESSQQEDARGNSVSRKNSTEIPTQSSRGSFLNIIPRLTSKNTAAGQGADSSQNSKQVGTFQQAPFQQGSPSSSQHTSNSSSQQHISNNGSGAWDEGGGRSVRAVGAIKAWGMGGEDPTSIRVSPVNRGLSAIRNHLFENRSEGFASDSSTNPSSGVARSTGSLANNQAGSPITGVRGLRNQQSLARQDTTSSGGVQEDLELLAAGGSGSGGMPGLQGSAPGVSAALNRMGARANAASLVEELPMGVRRLRVGTGSTKASISRAGSAVTGDVFLDSESSSPRTTAGGDLFV